jgi:hypothetical protein
MWPWASSEWPTRPCAGGLGTGAGGPPAMWVGLRGSSLPQKGSPEHVWWRSDEDPPWLVFGCALRRPIRALTQMRGYDASAHVLACFGGAGGQHACAIARALGMQTIFVHRWADGTSGSGAAAAGYVRVCGAPPAGQASSVAAPTWRPRCSRQSLRSALCALAGLRRCSRPWASTSRTWSQTCRSAALAAPL